MLELLTTHQFERDFIRQLKSGKDKKKFLEIINKLLNRQQLDKKHSSLLTLKTSFQFPNKPESIGNQHLAYVWF
jgi:mRNA-degrading endonuclease YafQ of YafQ-DinJ toxin-antitoxin module